ncbi:MAG: hypothetical protein IT360_16005 [Gemmatimonadaceae bacterium]|nr:hypothetical protein [Gemmatimonadaceae bacterium]
MSPRDLRSLRHQYALFVDREIDAYKEAVSSAHLSRIANLALDALADEPQIGMRELLLAAEVNRFIAKRLRLPSFRSWSGRQRRHANDPQRLEHWGLPPESPLARTVRAAPGDAPVLVSSSRALDSSLFLAANECHVTVVEPDTDAVQHVLSAAGGAGFGSRIHATVLELVDYRPNGELAGVVCTPSAFSGLARHEREEVVAALQRATALGGVHLVESIVDEQVAMPEGELMEWYDGWDVSVVAEGLMEGARAFVAVRPRR